MTTNIVINPTKIKELISLSVVVLAVIFVAVTIFYALTNIVFAIEEIDLLNSYVQNVTFESNEIRHFFVDDYIQNIEKELN